MTRPLAAAGRDVKALLGMEDANTFADQVFGFHAQQAAEKALKAWLALEGEVYPRTHDLSRLLRLLEDAGSDVARFQDLIEYNPFAVQLRYEAFELAEDPLDRKLAIERVQKLVDEVQRRLGGVPPAEVTPPVS